MNNVINALSYEENIIQLKLVNVPKHPLMIAKILSILSNCDINIDMISQVIVEDDVYLAVTLDQKYQKELNTAIVQLTNEFEGIQIYQDRQYSKIAIGGPMMEQTPGVAQKVFELLGKNNIHFYQITTSKRTISFVIKKKHLAQTLELLKKDFHI